MRVLATGVSVVLLVACGGKSKPPITAGSGSGSASASAAVATNNEHSPGDLFPHDQGGDQYGGDQYGYGGDQYGYGGDYGGDQYGYGGDQYGGGAPAEPSTVTIPASAPTVSVISKGKGKKAKLAFALVAGHDQKVEGAYNMGVSSDSFGNMVMPTIVADFDEQVLDVGSDGTAHVKLTITALDAKDREGQTMEASSFHEFLGESTGTTLETTIAANGGLGAQTITAPAGGTVDYMRQLMLPTIVFPDDKVGVGAKWKVVESIPDNNDIMTTVTTTYTLVKHKGNSITLSFAQTSSAAPQTINSSGMDMQVTKAEGTSSGKIVLDGSGRIPTGTTTLAKSLAFTMGDSSATSSTTIDTTLTAAK